MKKAIIALTSLAALTVTTVALAQEPATGAGPTPSPDVAEPPRPVTIPEPSVTGPETGTSMPASATTLTAANATATPPPPTLPPPRETITVRQTYRPNRPMLYTGSSMLLSSYVITATFTAVQGLRDANGNQPTYIPVAGPWMHLANSNMTLLDKGLLAGSGVAQGVGLGIGLLSLVVPERVPAATIEAGGVKVHVAVTPLGRGSAGIGAVGQF